MKKSKSKYVVGIDEAGRGPLAGPVAVAAVATLKDLRLKIKDLRMPLRDSKKLSAKQREEWRKILKKNFECHCVFVSHKIIDKINIRQATILGVEKVLKKFKKRPDLVLMDGSLVAPKKYKQKTIIKGDEKIPLIAAASIIAKTSRDKKMIQLHKKFPQYGFYKHKGYGTKEHIKAIRKFGRSSIHRKSFHFIQH